MEKKFARLMKKLLAVTNTKESDLANSIGYDTTSVSKWVSGAKLPSERNAETIIPEISSKLCERITEENLKALGLNSPKDLETSLSEAYFHDMSFHRLQPKASKKLSFIQHKSALYNLLSNILYQMPESGIDYIHIDASFDIFDFISDDFSRTLSMLSNEKIRHLTINACINTAKMEDKYKSYCRMLTNIITECGDVKLSLRRETPNAPSIIIVNDFIYIQVLNCSVSSLALCCSLDHGIVEYFSKVCEERLRTSEMVLETVTPEMLRRTNVQIDSLSSRRQRLFYNEAPSVLVPPKVMKVLAEKTEDKGYAEYLRRLSHVFEKLTPHSFLDLTVVASRMNQYTLDGDLSIANIHHRLTKEQTNAHLRQLMQGLKENPDFHMHLLRDTITSRNLNRRLPSIFIDDTMVTIEDSKREPNASYYMSMDPQIKHAFEKYYDNITGRPDCRELTAEDILRYL